LFLALLEGMNTVFSRISFTCIRRTSSVGRLMGYLEKEVVGQHFDPALPVLYSIGALVNQ
jgi:hypothetical protein